MTVTFSVSKAKGDVVAPPSKSMAHRALICGALSQGSTIKGCGESKDMEATIGCLSAMGAKVERDGDFVSIGELNPFSIKDLVTLDCIESGSTLRFLLPLCLLSGTQVTLKGSERLFQRPLQIYEEICASQKILFCKDKNSVTVKGKLQPGKFAVPGNVSSQFITGLLFTLPLLNGDSLLEITGNIESASYIDLTLNALADFGIKIYRNDNIFTIPGNQKYSNCTYTVEGDFSNASFLDGLNLLGGEVNVQGLSDKSKQGDKVYKEYYEKLMKGEKLFDLSDCPDLGPVMFALAAAKGGARFIGTARLRLKESDRCEAMAEELQKMGISVKIEENAVEVLPGELKAPTKPLSGHNDHRIVMALSLLCTLVGGTIEGAKAVNKSYPEFFDTLKSLQIGLNIN